MRRNSRSLLVIRMRAAALACAAIHKSLLPIICPRLQRGADRPIEFAGARREIHYRKQARQLGQLLAGLFPELAFFGAVNEFAIGDDGKDRFPACNCRNRSENRRRPSPPNVDANVCAEQEPRGISKAFALLRRSIPATVRQKIGRQTGQNFKGPHEPLGLFPQHDLVAPAKISTSVPFSRYSFGNRTA